MGNSRLKELIKDVIATYCQQVSGECSYPPNDEIMSTFGITYDEMVELELIYE